MQPGPAQIRESLVFPRGRHAAALIFSGAVSAAVLIAGIAGCRRTSGDAQGLRIDTQIEPQPAKVGPATITLHIADEKANPVTGAHVQIEGELRSREIATKNSDFKRRIWEIRADSILKLDRAEKAGLEDQDTGEEPAA